jgi:hypothetical protein
VIGPFGNPDGLRTLATALTTAGTDVSTNASSVGGKVDALTASKWTGGAASAFQTHWNGEYTNMVDLGLSASIIARVLDDLATSLDQANQIVLQAAAQAALQGTVSAATLNVTGAATAASSMAAAIQRATQIAQKAWAQATSQLAGVTVPKIGAFTTPQQAQSWASSALTAAPAVPTVAFPFQSGNWQQQSKRPPFPPFPPPLDPALNDGGLWFEPGPNEIAPGPFPGGSWITIQPSFNGNAGDVTLPPEGSGGLSGGDVAVIAALVIAMAGLGIFSLTHPAQGPLNGSAITILPAYITPPKTLPAFPNAVPAKAKTPFGGGIRKRWVLPDGRILEWDYQHGTVEMYDKRGRHLGEYDPNTGQQTKPPDPTRRITP